MTLAMRFTSAATKTLYGNAGRTYTVTDGSYIDIPFPDGAAIQSDQATPLMVTGLTADRPTNAGWPNVGFALPSVMYDTTLGAVIFRVPNSNPTSWVKIDGTAA